MHDDPAPDFSIRGREESRNNPRIAPYANLQRRTCPQLEITACDFKLAISQLSITPWLLKTKIRSPTRAQAAPSSIVSLHKSSLSLYLYIVPGEKRLGA